jgi:predicted  nucleic acid-binding Zn-ribbon protein
MGSNYPPLSLKQYKEKLQAVNSKLLPLPKQTYINSYTPLKHKCKDCGHTDNFRPDFIYTPGKSSSKNDRNCPQCREKSGGKRNFTLDKYNNSLPKRYIALDYINAYTDVYHTCSLGHTFSQKPSIMLQSPQCPFCPTKLQWKKYKALKPLYKEKGILIHSISRTLKSRNATIKCACQRCGNEWSKPLSQILKPCSACKPVITSKVIKRKINNSASLEVREQQMRSIIKEKFLGKINLIQHTNKGTVCNCNDCGHEWETNYILQTKHGCPNCASKHRGTVPKYTHEQYSELLIINNNIKPAETFRSLYKRINHTCLVCNTTFEALPKKVMAKGCPDCSNTYKIKGASPISQVWLRILERELKLPIQRAETSIEKDIFIKRKNYRVDGYCESLNLVFEFLGSIWHGDPYVGKNAVHPHAKGSKTKLFNDNFKRFTQLTKEGYNVCWVWESQFSKGSLISGILYGAKR